MKREVDAQDQPSIKDGDGFMRPAKRKRVSTSSLAVEGLPNAQRYEVSYMHRDVVTHVAVARKSEFILTASRDGHVKFWRKMPTSIEFVKHFVAHLERLVSFVVSSDDQRLLTASTDGMAKIFDVVAFDMTAMIDLGFIPSYATWLNDIKIVAADSKAPVMRVFDLESDGGGSCLQELKIHHSQPVASIAFNAASKAMISVDTKGIIEYWDNENSFELLNSDNRSKLSFRLKSETDLYELAKKKTTASSMSVAKQGDKFAVCATNRTVYVFHFNSGKILHKFEESAAYYGTEEASNISCLGEGFDMGSRLSQQVELEKETAFSAYNAVFDQSGQFLFYGSPLGIKMVNMNNGAVERVLCQQDDSERFLHLALYQGVPKVDKQYLLSKSKDVGKRDGSAVVNMPADPESNDDSSKATQREDPTIFCTAFNKKRFYCLSSREPPTPSALGERDIFNEPPTEDELDRVLESKSKSRKSLPSAAVLHTTMGDITVKLHAEECPRTVENFTTHASNGYYDHTIFHRVIKNFMIQGGDPEGNGTGGESIWGGSFDDEIVPKLRHSLPFVLSMANSGPGTNGSQFFITTTPTPHLDDKHTVFGKVTKGFEVVSAIESVMTGDRDMPLRPVKVLSIEC